MPAINVLSMFSSFSQSLCIQPNPYKQIVQTFQKNID
jgi:hypothetical protein